MKIQIRSNKGENVGEIDTLEQVYYSTRNNNENQVFHHFGNALAVDEVVLLHLIREDVQFICILVVALEQHSFFAVSSMQNFLINSEKISYKHYGAQRRMPLSFWKRASSISEAKKIMFGEQLPLTRYSSQ